MQLTDLRPAKGASKRRKIVGRGHGSGHGHTACRGMKGQNSRSGGGVKPGFEGGQMPLSRRLPKRGFTSRSKNSYAVVNLDQLENNFQANAEITPQALLDKKIINNVLKGVKILGRGEIKKNLTVKAQAYSVKAKEMIEKAGGKVEMIKP
ncbi:MAG: 50S ribosomal protein L15 [Elusimicrobia bacterium]|nr:50S ribosomal protein L15 [Elusimicrobiota bacterium]